MKGKQESEGMIMAKNVAVALILLFTSPALAGERKDMDELISKLIPALIQVESGGRNLTGGDRDSVGILQIRKCVVDCVNEYVEGAGFRYTYEDRRNPILAQAICGYYLEKWGKRSRTGKKPTLEILARIYNGGPTGYKKKSTERYWVKVQVELRKQGGK